MDLTRENIAVAVGGAVAVLLQIIVAPNIAVFSAMPNFVLAYVLAVSIARPNASSLVLAFVLGLLYGLIGTGPVGAMAFLLVLASYLFSRAFSVLDNDTLFMPLVILVVSAFAIEALYAAFLIGLGTDVGFVDAFVYRALPCALYDSVAALVLYPLVTRFVVQPAKAVPMDPTQLR